MSDAQIRVLFEIRRHGRREAGPSLETSGLLPCLEVFNPVDVGLHEQTTQGSFIQRS